MTERSSATKRPAGEEEEGGDEEEEFVEGPKKKISFGLNKPKGTTGLAVPAKKPLGGISIKLGQAQVSVTYWNDRTTVSCHFDNSTSKMMLQRRHRLIL